MIDLLALSVLILMLLGIALVLQLAPWRAATERGASHQVPFLGGSEPSVHAWQRYHVRYYPMVLLFIAFEMEMMFMYPWAVVFVEKGAMAMMEMGMFLVILSVGIVYGWREKVFGWQ